MKPLADRLANAEAVMRRTLETDKFKSKTCERDRGDRWRASYNVSVRTGNIQ